MNILNQCVLSSCLFSAVITAQAQIPAVNPQVGAKAPAEGKITTVEIAPHFVTGIRLPEPVNEIAVGDPALFQVEHSEREPELVLVKALTEKLAETNLLVSSIHGRQYSLLLISHGKITAAAKVDFLLQYRPAKSFLVEPAILPFPFVSQRKSVLKSETAVLSGRRL